MNIKSKINIIRGILYLQEIILCKSISKAAEKNNIKASNLSVMINNLEEQIGNKLLIRSPQGCVPTGQGCKIAEYAQEVHEILQKLSRDYSKNYPKNKILNIYTAPNVTLDDYLSFEKEHEDVHLNFVEENVFADISIDNHPSSDRKRKYVELHIGNGVKQKIWIYCNEQNPLAMDFFDFIIAKLLLLYDQ